MNLSARVRLLQMSSPAFPIGGYSHSFGLESAIEQGVVRDEKSVQRWILDMLDFSVGTYEVPMLCRMEHAWAGQDTVALNRLNDEFLATREAAELRAGSVQMGFSMRKLLEVLPDLPEYLQRCLHAMREPSLPCVWSGAAHAWGILRADSITGYVWSWAENQVLVALKSVPIGQSSGQRILLVVAGAIAVLVERLPQRCDDAASNFAPGLAILSCQHETQYSRLFRS